MINYALHDNVLTPDPNDAMAIVQDTKKCTLDDLVQDVTGTGSILKETECNAVMPAIFRALGKRLQNGEGFISEFLVIDRSISGVFTNEEDYYDSERHQINTNVRLGSTLAKMAGQSEVKKVPAIKKQPLPESFRDLKSKTYNDLVTPGQFAEIIGKDLKINGLDKLTDLDNNVEGVFFTDSKGVETRVKEIANNLPGKLTIEIPDSLKKGEYTLEIRNIRRGTKTLRKGRLNETLVVA